MIQTSPRLRRWLLAPVLLSLLEAPVLAQNTSRAGVDEPFYSGISSPQSLERVVEQHLSRADASRRLLLAVKSGRTEANTLVPYDRLWNQLQNAQSLARVMARLHPDAQMRATAEALTLKVTKVVTELTLRADVYEALRALPTALLSVDARRLIERELRDFRLSGVDRPEEVRSRLKQLHAELQATVEEFDRNLLNGQRTIVATAAELEGLPPDFVAARHPDQSGGTRLTTDDVDALPVLLYARNATLRERLQRQRWRVATPQNIVALSRIITLRHQIATTLGFPTWAEYYAQTRMANSQTTVTTFLERLTDAVRPAATREYLALLQRKQQDDPAATVVQEWDRAYYTERVRRSAYDFDSQQVRVYFPYDRVRAGVMQVASRLFDVTFRPVTLPTWHADVETFEMWRGSRLLGRIYLDVHPRAQKVNSGASSPYMRRGIAGVQIPEIVLVASVPGGASDRPGLLTHGQVRTLFHEFGHVMHGVLGGQGFWSRLNGWQLEADAMEVPSSLFEEWIWDAAALATFARHYQTGEPIPARLVDQMRRAGEFGKALEADRLAVRSRISLRLHATDPATLELAAVAGEAAKDSVMPPFASTMVAQFTHLANPLYTSAYYTYLWSQVIAKDLFSRFDPSNLLAPQVAHQYRDKVLVPGGSRTATQLFTDFLGRPFTFDAWTVWVNEQAQ